MFRFQGFDFYGFFACESLQYAPVFHWQFFSVVFCIKSLAQSCKQNVVARANMVSNPHLQCFPNSCSWACNLTPFVLDRFLAIEKGDLVLDEQILHHDVCRGRSNA